MAVANAREQSDLMKHKPHRNCRLSNTSAKPKFTQNRRFICGTVRAIDNSCDRPLRPSMKFRFYLNTTRQTLDLNSWRPPELWTPNFNRCQRMYIYLENRFIRISGAVVTVLCKLKSCAWRQLRKPVPSITWSIVIFVDFIANKGERACGHITRLSQLSTGKCVCVYSLAQLCALFDCDCNDEVITICITRQTHARIDSFVP